MANRARVLMAWSSGKDSAWALHELRRDPNLQVEGLLTTLSRSERAVPIHGVAEALVDAQAGALQLPLAKVWLPSPCTNVDYERELGAALLDARKQGITHLAFGDLFLEDVRRYRETSLRDAGLSLLFPLWGRETGALATEMVAGGLRCLVTAVDTTQLDGRWAGSEFDRPFLGELPSGVDPCGERGEFHTFVYDGPMFARPVPIIRGLQRTDGRFETVDLRLRQESIS